MGDSMMNPCRQASSNESDTFPLLTKALDEHGYTMKKELGRGVSGRVFLVQNTDGDPYVIKQINSRDTRETTRVENEVKILKAMDCGYIVRLVDSFQDTEFGLWYIGMEYCAGGDLSMRMQAQYMDIGIFEEEQITDWLVQMCLALQHLHDNKRNVLHRDIKPQNMFLTEDGYINLGDFGFSKILQGYAVSSFKGPDLYTCPEVLNNNPHTSKSDIYSLGWVLYDLCMLDVWSKKDERRFKQASHNVGKPIDFSERYSLDLQELVKEMISLDPKTRPSAEEILAKPFLRNTVDRNKKIPEKLVERFINAFDAFDEAYSRHYEHFEALVKEWGETTTALEETHRKCTIGALSGSVMGAAGGITAIVGAILAPFTLGASLIVAGVGAGVGVAGGVTGAASSITNTVKQKSLRENLEGLQKSFEKVSAPIIDSMNKLRRVLRTVQKFRDFLSDSSHNVKMLCNVDKNSGACAAELVNLGLLANVGRIVAQTARVGRAAAVAITAATGVLSGLLVIADVAFIVKDSKEIHQIRMGRTNDPENIKSTLLKSIAQMRKTHTELLNVLKEITETRESLNGYIQTARFEYLKI